MTNIRRSHREFGAPKTATFPASFPRGRPEGKGCFLVADGGVDRCRTRPLGDCCRPCLSPAVARQRQEAAAVNPGLCWGKASAGQVGAQDECVSGARGHYGRERGGEGWGGSSGAEGVMDGRSGWPSSRHDPSLSWRV